MVKITRKLTQELKEPPRQGARAFANRCALEQKLSCCDGRGYLVDRSGAVVEARLCSCVESCPSCFGKTRKLQNGLSLLCKEPSPLQIVKIINSAGLPSHYAQARLDQFANFTGNGREIVSRVGGWIKEFKPKKSKGLILGGPVGVGKTFLLCAIAKAFAAKGHTVKFVDFFQLLSELKAGYGSNKADDTLLAPLIHVDVLVIDELGKGRNSDWEISILDQLVMGRYNQDLTIVGSTNYGLKPDPKKPVGFNVPLDQEDHTGFHLNEFATLESRVGSRIYSRLMEMCHMVDLSGDDFRKQFLTNSTGMLTLDTGKGLR